MAGGDPVKLPRPHRRTLVDLVIAQAIMGAFETARGWFLIAGIGTAAIAFALCVLAVTL